MFNKEVIAEYTKYIDNEEVTIMVLLEKGSAYYDVHRITERYKNDELNSLDMQEPVEAIDNPKEYFNNAYMIARLMEYIIWDRFYSEGDIELSIDIKFEPREEY